MKSGKSAQYLYDGETGSKDLASGLNHVTVSFQTGLAMGIQRKKKWRTKETFCCNLLFSTFKLVLICFI